MSGKRFHAGARAPMRARACVPARENRAGRLPPRRGVENWELQRAPGGGSAAGRPCARRASIARAGGRHIAADARNAGRGSFWTLSLAMLVAGVCSGSEGRKGSGDTGAGGWQRMLRPPHVARPAVCVACARAVTLRLRGGAGPGGVQVGGTSVPIAEAGSATGQGVGGVPWGGPPAGVEWETEPTSTDDWSTGEWFDATWKHFRTEEQINKFRFPGESSSEDSQGGPNPGSQGESRTLARTSRRKHSGGTGRAGIAGQEQSDVDIFNPDCGVEDIDTLVKEVKQYDISSDSESYDNTTSSDSDTVKPVQEGSGGGRWHIDHAKMQECIENTQAVESYFAQLHIDDPAEMGMRVCLCKAGDESVCARARGHV